MKLLKVFFQENSRGYRHMAASMVNNAGRMPQTACFISLGNH